MRFTRVRDANLAFMSESCFQCYGLNVSLVYTNFIQFYDRNMNICTRAIRHLKDITSVFSEKRILKGIFTQAAREGYEDEWMELVEIFGFDNIPVEALKESYKYARKYGMKRILATKNHVSIGVRMKYFLGWE